MKSGFKSISAFKLKSEWIVHFIAWLLLFLSPLLFMNRGREDLNLANYFRGLVVPSALCIAFYVNYLYLIPKYLLKYKTKKFIAVNAVFIITLGALLHALLFLSHLGDMMPPRENEKWFFIHWGFYVRDIFSLALIVSLSVALRMSRRLFESESVRLKMEKDMTQAELQNLKNQINPHFLLNTLNNIYALIEFDTAKAQKAVIDLSKLLRYVLYDNRQLIVPVQKEINFLNDYIELMKIRLSDKVKVTVTVDIDNNSELQISPMIFISLIENAFKHGVKSSCSSSIDIRISEEDEDSIRCVIRNTNFPKDVTDKSGSGIGLMQVKRRLELMYPDAYRWKYGVVDNGMYYESDLVIYTKRKKKDL